MGDRVITHRIARCAFGVLFVALLAGALQPAWAVLPTPNQPILIVQNSSSTDRYQNFIPELLRTEGLNGFQTAQLTELTASFLSNYDVVILPHLALTSGQTTLFQNYVNAGGILIGFRPDLKLASVFGVASLGSTLSEAWLKIDTSTPYTSGLESQAMRFHGTADRYSLSGATALATLYNNPGSATASPAAAIYSFGQGKAILFSFDLMQSVVLMRQGNPAWAGYPNTHDGYGTMRPSQMFMDEDSGQFWNDLGDGALYDVPQADIQMRLFSNALMVSNTAKRPLPRLWYFPSQNRALLLLTGDHHGDSATNSVNEINAVQTAGGKFTEFLWYPFGNISSSQVNSWLSDGHGIGVHFDATALVDSTGVGGSAPTWNGMQNVINTALTSFAANYPGAPFPTTTRNHWLIWLSRNAAGAGDQTAQAKLFRDADIELDTTFAAFPNRWGYMTGSGLPMKFLDTATGEVIPVYEQATQYEDDIQLSNVNYALNWDVATAQSHYQQSLSDSLTKYNTVITMLFHPDHWNNYQNYVQTVLQYAQLNSIPMYSAPSWLQFWKARAATSMSKPSFASNTLAFTATGAPDGLTLQVPQASGSNKVVSSFQVDGVPQNFSVATYQGVMYANVNLTAGTHNITVTYTPAGRILGQISPSGAASNTTVQIQGGSITQSVPLAPDGTYVAGPLPAGNYTVTPSSASYVFSPVSRSVTLSTADVTNVNFTASTNPGGQTLFTTQVPAVTNVTDGQNEELGTVFTSITAGQITGIRFWKGSSEVGTHVGKIWSGTGQLLVSVTFTSETASGWQQQPLPTPLAIQANTPYVVSVNTSNTFFSFTHSGLATQVVNGDLRSVVGNNGVFGSTNQFPTGSFDNSNYFRDIMFVPGITYSISGTITPGSSASGTTVTLGGAANATTTADSAGNYSFNGLANGNYTVTPTKSGFSFSPTSAPVTINNANMPGVNFTVAPTTFSISGTISPAASGSGATVTLSGAASASATADSSGNFSFSGLADGNYTVTPSKGGFSFTPTQRSVTVSGADVTGISFSASAIGGQTLLTTQTPVLTNDTDGHSEELGTKFTSLTPGQITAIRYWKAGSETGIHVGRIWSSTGQLLASATFTNETASGWQQQALATPLTIAANTQYVVSVNSTFFVATLNGLASQVVNGDLRSVVGNNGAYNNSPGQFPTLSFQNSNYFRDVVFVAGTTFSISGTISPAASGSGTTVTLSGAANATTTADGSGNYSFTGLSNGNYTVTPSKSGFTFSPASAPATVNNANVTGINFTASAAPTFSISGTISPAASGSGATVTLSGAASATTTADGSGNFTFTGLSNGSYTVTPSKSGFTFSPANAPATVNNANVTGVNFAASAAGQTLFTTQTPLVGNDTDGFAEELGMKFTSTVAGQITAIRYWKASSETGTHIGRIWSSTGQLLASATFTNETASGWQQQALTTPLSIAANTQYVVSVNSTFFVISQSGLASQVVNGNLRSVVGSNGVWGNAGLFPTTTWENSNYFRDVVFIAN
jgi:hypothetical protein